MRYLILQKFKTGNGNSKSRTSTTNLRKTMAGNFHSQTSSNYVGRAPQTCFQLLCQIWAAQPNPSLEEFHNSEFEVLCPLDIVSVSGNFYLRFQPHGQIGSIDLPTHPKATGRRYSSRQILNLVDLRN